MTDIFADHILPDVVKNARLGFQAIRTVARLPQSTAKSIWILGIKFAELFRAAVGFPSRDSKGPIHLTLDGVMVELEFVHHREDVAAKIAKALPQQE